MSPPPGWVHTDATRAKMRAAAAAKKARGFSYRHSEETLAKMRQGQQQHRAGLAARAAEEVK